MSEIVAANGRRIFFDDSGAGDDRPTLLLIAGRGGARRSWEPQVAAFASALRVITLDNRDAGESDQEEASYTMADLADDAVALLDALGIARAHVAGISMGGMIALQLALNHAARVERLVLIATTAGGWSPQQRHFFTLPPDPWIADPVERARVGMAEIIGPAARAAFPSRLPEVLGRARGNGFTAAGYVRQNGAIATHDVRARLGEIVAPTLVIHGDVDPLVPFAQGQLLAAEIPGARALFLSGVGHLPPFERPDEVNRAILDFLGAGRQSPAVVSA